jgi:heat shock protein HslJ
MRRTSIFTLALVAGLGLGCRSTPSESVPPAAAGPAGTGPAAIEGTTWRLVEVDGRAVAADATNVPPTILLDPATHSVSGSTGCNGLRGSYTLDGARLTFGPLISTLMACLKGMDVESAMSGIFTKVDGYQLSGDTLTLTGGGSPLARFEAQGS